MANPPRDDEVAILEFSPQVRAQILNLLTLQKEPRPYNGTNLGTQMLRA